MGLLNGSAISSSGASPLGLNDFPFTFACWARRTASGGSLGIIMSLGNSVSSRNNHSLGHNSIYRAQTSSRVAGTEYLQAGTLIAQEFDLNAWHPVVMVVEATSRTVYFDDATSFSEGTTISFTDGTDSINGASARFTLRRAAWNFTNDFSGLIAHAAVWDSALSEADRNAFLAGGNPLAISASTLKAYWAEDFFDDAGTWKYTDETGNNYHLSIPAESSIDTTTTGPTVAAPPATTTPGIVIAGIKEANEADTLVTGVSNALLYVWTGTAYNGPPALELENQSITAGTMTVNLGGLESATVDSPYIATWTREVAPGDIRYGRATGTIVDLSAP